MGHMTQKKEGAAGDFLRRVSREIPGSREKDLHFL